MRAASVAVDAQPLPIIGKRDAFGGSELDLSIRAEHQIAIHATQLQLAHAALARSRA